MKLDEALRIFRVFSDRTRLRIFLLLLDSELCVGELVALLKIEQSLLSHQLGSLRQAGLVEARRSGRWIYYRIPTGYRKQLEPVFRDWFREELAVSGPKVKAVKEKQVCLNYRSGTCRPEPPSRPKSMVRGKAAKGRGK
ncbi:MAG: metalloregulator ArsR/SmtB family transcription factor [Candidatus Saccharicenans sp.]|nr:metalloregulator ArsR/SmtB family transcription factor [Candidatus Saccharicenans sp.]